MERAKLLTGREQRSGSLAFASQCSKHSKPDTDKHRHLSGGEAFIDPREVCTGYMTGFMGEDAAKLIGVFGLDNGAGVGEDILAPGDEGVDRGIRDYVQADIRECVLYLSML